jgi:hypothetical protein
MEFARVTSATRDGIVIGSVPGGIHRRAELEARRKPRLLFRLSGVFLLRFAERAFVALLFQLPPRFTRFEPIDHAPDIFVTLSYEIANWPHPPHV